MIRLNSYIKFVELVSYCFNLTYYTFIMMANFIVVFLLSFSITFAVDPCRFEYPGKVVIDLTTVAHSDGTAAFPDVIPASSPHFSMWSLYIKC